MTGPTSARAPRADARRNRERVLDAARTVIAEQGTQASLREIARHAGVGLGTLYRHFPTRDALLEALLGRGFDELAERARTLADTRPSGEALTEWLHEFLAGSTAYRGVAASMMATIDDESSPLHASCQGMREAVARLLARAQESGHVREDVDGTDLLALVSAIGWLSDQAPTLADRRDHLFTLVLSGLTNR